MRLLTVLLVLAGCSGSVSDLADVGGRPGVDASRPGVDSGLAAGLDASTAAGLDASSVDPTIGAWLAQHNAVRAAATPAPSPALPALTWNAAAAATALAWAQNCNWSHNAGRGNYGENIAAATHELSPESVVSMWADEARDYSYSTNGCTHVCGHYTQLVWRDTTSVGCAVNHCASNSPFGGGGWYFAVCDYAPPGNFVGQKPY